MKAATDPDRYLQKRPDGGYRYVRRIPALALAILRAADASQSVMVRRTLKTAKLDEARGRRDAMEMADDDYWARLGGSADDGDSYQRALARANPENSW